MAEGLKVAQKQWPATLHEVAANGAPLSKNDRLCFQEDGAILLRGAIATEAFATIERDLCQRIRLIERHHGLAAAAEGQDMAAINARLLHIYAQLPQAQGAIYDAMALAPSLCRFAALDTIHQYVTQLLSPIFAIHPRRILLMSPPENQWHLPVWHQDWFYNEGPHSTLTLYAPLQRTTSFNGGMKLALGEWQKGFIDHGDHDHGVRTKWQSLPVDAVGKFSRIAEPELERGDVILFNSLVPHSAQVNRSQAVRMVVNLRFQDLTDSAFIDAWWRTGAIAHARHALARKPEPKDPQ